MPQPEWVTSLGSFPFSFRSKICSTKLGRLRREGVLIKGTDYETLANALNWGYEVGGYTEGRGSRSIYVYHVENCMERLQDHI